MATLDEVTRIRFEGREMYTELEGGMLEINVTKSKLASLIGGSLRCLGIGNTTHCSGMCCQSASFKTMVGAERESKSNVGKYKSAFSRGVSSGSTPRWRS